MTANHDGAGRVPAGAADGSAQEAQLVLLGDPAAAESAVDGDRDVGGRVSAAAGRGGRTRVELAAAYGADPAEAATASFSHWLADAGVEAGTDAAAEQAAAYVFACDEADAAGRYEEREWVDE